MFSSSASYFKDEHPFDCRVSQCTNLRAKYPDRIPIIIQKKVNAKNVADISTTKYLVPDTMIMSQFMVLLRKRIKVESHEGLFVFVNNVLVPNSASLLAVYKEHMDLDGFLYMMYTGENVFG